MLNFFIFLRFKRSNSGANIFNNQLDLADEKIVTYLLEARLGFIADLSKFVDCLSILPSKVKNPWTCSLFQIYLEVEQTGRLKQIICYLSERRTMFEILPRVHNKASYHLSPFYKKQQSERYPLKAVDEVEVSG